MSKKNELQLLSEATDKYNITSFNGANGIEQMVKMGEGIKAMNDLLTPDIMKKILYLKNNNLGFATDEQPDKGKVYPESVVKNVLIEALLTGLLPINNNFMIIAERLYIRKEGFEYLLKKLPGFTDFVIGELGVPKVENNKTVVNFCANWKMNGKPQELSGTIPINTNSSSTVDNTLGKAQRKILARVYATVTGSAISEMDASEINQKPINKQAARAAELMKGKDNDKPTQDAATADK